MGMHMKATEIHLASRPTGEPVSDNFRTVVTELPPLEDGQILVRNTVMSVDPYMRGRMNDVKSYVPPFALDAPLDGGAVGEVVESRSDAFAVGDAVSHGKGWRDLAILPAKSARKVDLSKAKASAYLGALGMTGLTAYAGLTSVAQFKEGDTVFVSGAAGAVGSLVGQIAKAMGCRAVGIAGGAEKCRLVTEEFNFDACLDYKSGDLGGQIKDAAPDGIDVYFDNVGGEMLDMVLALMNAKGRIPVCGVLSQYNAEDEYYGVTKTHLIFDKQLRLQGFLNSEFRDQWDRDRAELENLVASGKLKCRETVAQGLKSAPQAFIGML